MELQLARSRSSRTIDIESTEGMLISGNGSSIDIYKAGVSSGRGLIGLLAAAAFAWLGIFHISIYRKFTPIYSQTLCGETATSVGTVHFDMSTLTLLLNLQMNCLNPNPYKIDILASTPGRVYIGSGTDPWQHHTQVGQLEVLPGSSLQEHGSGLVNVTVNVAAPGHLLPELIQDSTFAILLELNFQISLAVSFGFGSWSASTPIHKACGLNVAGLLGGESSSGDQASHRFSRMVCQPTFDNLVIPPVGEETPADDKIGFAGGELAPNKIYEGTVAKNLSLGFAILVCFVGVACSLYFGFHSPAPCDESDSESGPWLATA